MATPFIDDFTGTNGDDLDAHTPSGGTAWTRVGAGATVCEISSNATTMTGIGAPNAYQCDDQSSANHYVQAQFTQNANMGTNMLAVRLNSGDDAIGHTRQGAGSGGARLSQTIAGTTSDVITFQGVANEWMKVEADGNSISLFVGGTGGTPSWTQEGATQTMTEYNTETRQGIRCGGANVSGIWIDNFEAGALSSGTTITAEPTDVARGEASVTLTGTSFEASQGTGTVTFGGETCTVTSWADTSIDVTIPSDIDLLYADSTYTFLVTSDSSGNDTSAAVDFNPESGRSYITLSSPVFSTDAYMLFGFTGTPDPVTGDQLEYDTTTVAEAIANTPGTDSEWILASSPSTNQTTTCQILRNATDVRSSDWVITWDVVSDSATLGDRRRNHNIAYSHMTHSMFNKLK